MATLLNGDRIFPAMLEAIRSASHRINFETYTYEEGDVAERFTAALVDAAARGVEVNLVMDAMGSSMKASHLKRMTTAEEIAHTVVFTASPRSSHTTGQILYVDGGFSQVASGLVSADA